MKYTLYHILLGIFLLGCLVACREDEEIRFDVPVRFTQPLEFREIPGGAVMKYRLPGDTEIFGVRLRYNDAWGNNMVKDGSYLCDSLVITGFTEAHDKTKNPVKANLSFYNRSMAETEPIEVEFGTLASATVAIFDSIFVNPYWGGFNVTYRSPETVSGMMHIFYIGENPTTHEPDSILMGSVAIAEGGDTLNFILQQVMDKTDVIVRTDDFKGYRVMQRVWKDLPCLSMDTLTSADFDFEFTGDEVELPEYLIGHKYVLDGDKKGTEYRKYRLDGYDYKYSTYVAGPWAFWHDDEPEANRFIVDLREPRVPASVNLYVYNFFNTQGWPGMEDSWVEYPEVLKPVWGGAYSSRLPSKITLYGTNDDPKTVSLASCARLFALDDEVDFDAGFKKSWASRTDNLGGTDWKNNYLEKSDAELAAAEPVVLKMLCNYSGDEYRYLIFVVEDTYNDDNYYDPEVNKREYVSFNELEVCVKAE